MRRCAALGVVLVAVAASSARAATRTYALVVAENRSQDPNVPPLRYADDDGVSDYELFSLFADHAALFAVLDDETARLHPDAARKAEVDERAAITARVAEWNKMMEADLARGDEPELYFLYAGHGDVDPTGMGYVSLRDGKLTRAELFRDLVGPSRARFVHVVIDACKSYFMVNARGGAPSEYKDDRADDSHDDDLRQYLAQEQVDRYPRVGVIVATSGDQETHEWSRWQGGILSHELRSALYGAADVNGDGRVEYSELRAFIAAANARVQNPEARLDVFARAPEADRHRPLVDLRRAQTALFLHFAPPAHGAYHLEDDRGVRVLDMNKEASSEFDLALDPGRTYYLRHDDGSGPETEAEVKPIAIKPRRIRAAELAFRPRALAARGALEQTFRRDLYRVPFGRGFYDGFVAQTGDLAVDGDSAPFVVAEPPAPKRFALSAGYLVSGAPLDVPGAMHGADVRLQYRALKLLDVGVAAEVAYGADEGQSLTRVALLGTVALRWQVLARLALRLDGGFGWQYASGTVQSPVGLAQGSDPKGARAEVAGGLVIDLSTFFAISARGGLAVDVATLKLPGQDGTTSANLSPLFDISAIVRL